VRWPKHLFFASHVTTAAKIIASGCLRSRDTVGRIEHDVANQEALGTNRDAWKYVRLYFRPRTDFHLRTEGIKLLTDRWRFDAHMSIPFMFVLNLDKVVTRHDASFCDRKMAHVGIVPGSDETYFDTIDFAKVYHEAPISDPQLRREINDRGMAEVLVPDELPLRDGVLEAIVCRTQIDALTLQYLARGQDRYFLDKIRVSTRPVELFFCWGAYVEDFQFSGNALTLRVRASRDYKQGQALKFRIVQERGGSPHMVWNANVALADKPLRISGFDANVQESWLVEIEDALAFCGRAPSIHANVFKN